MYFNNCRDITDHVINFPGTPEKQGHRYEPGDLAGTSQRYENEVRGDIILFYNTVYVKKMQAFAMKFAENTSKVSVFF